MNSTTIEKLKSKRPRKFAREPQADPASIDRQPPQDINDAAVLPPPKPKSKANLLLDLLARPEGATLQQMVAATGWLPHTTRAALTGLKKKCDTVTSIKTDGVRTYRLVTGEGAQVTSTAEVDAKAPA